jgi:hypothetical protein
MAYGQYEMYPSNALGALVQKPLERDGSRSADDLKGLPKKVQSGEFAIQLSSFRFHHGVSM